MIDKKYFLIFLLIILAGLSGCIDLITTQEKQACLALTHYSSTSIGVCASQNTCFKQANSLDIYTSKHLPYEINNSLLAYKNYIGSSYFYYNKTAKLLEEVNSACQEGKVKKIIDSMNLMMFYFSETATYLDYTSKESINLIRDYTLFLENQEVNLIAEEDIYNDYILLNQNLNQLKEKKEDETYISKLNIEVKNLYEYAKSIGFRKTYLHSQNMFELSEYYVKILEGEFDTQHIEIPLITEASYFIVTKVSKIYDLKQINLNLSKASGYNFYNILDKFIGKDNSLVTDFKNINNRINYNLDDIYKEILEKEKYIDDNLDKLTFEKQQEFLKNKKEFENQNISFGRYLSYLKETKIIIDVFKVTENKTLNECDLIINDAKQYTNFYFKENILEYENSKDYFVKKEICEKIKMAMEEKECFEKIDLFFKTDTLEKEDFELLIIKDDFECREVLGNINYVLKDNLKIKLYNENLEVVKEKLKEIEKHIKDLDLKKEIVDIKEKIYKKEENIVKIINIDSKIQEIIKINERLDVIITEILKDEEYYKIKLIENKYYLYIENPFKQTIHNLEISLNYENIKSLDSNLKVKNNKIILNIVYPGENYYLVEIENEKEIVYEIIYLEPYNSILRLKIKNKVEGIHDSILFLDNFETKTKNTEIVDNEIKYISEKENEIYLVGPLFEVEVIKTIEEINLEKIIVIEKIYLKNIYFKEINQNINFKVVNQDEIVTLFEKNKEVDFDIIDQKILFFINIKKEETKEYKLQTLKDKKVVFIEIDSILLEIYKYSNTRFENLRNESENLFKNIKNKEVKENYTIEEIKEIYGLEKELNQIRNKYNKYEIYEKEYLLMYVELIEKELTETEKNKIEKIESERYKNIEKSKEELAKIYNDIKNKNEKVKQIVFEENLEKTKELKEIIITYGIEGIDVDDLIKEKSYEEIELMIIQKLKDKANQIYYKISPLINNLDTRNITEIVNKIYWLFEDYNLRDLYSVSYFVGVTENDAKRLEKNMVFLDGVLFNKEIINFQEALENKDYQKAINSISLETINRVDKIKIDYDNLKEGIEIIKNDAKTEILEYQKQEYDLEILELAKTNYEDEKYLNTILLLKNQTEIKPRGSNTSQIIIFSVIIVLFGTIYAYFRLGNNKKEENTKDKKKKILRH